MARAAASRSRPASAAPASVSSGGPPVRTYESCAAASCSVSVTSWAAAARCAELGQVKERRRLEHSADHQLDPVGESAPFDPDPEYVEQAALLVGREGAAKRAPAEAVDERAGAGFVGRGRAGNQGGETLAHRLASQRLCGDLELIGEHAVDALIGVDREAALPAVGREFEARLHARPEQRGHGAIVFGVRQAADTGRDLRRVWIGPRDVPAGAATDAAATGRSDAADAADAAGRPAAAADRADAPAGAARTSRRMSPGTATPPAMPAQADKPSPYEE